MQPSTVRRRRRQQQQTQCETATQGGPEAARGTLQHIDTGEIVLVGIQVLGRRWPRTITGSAAAAAAAATRTVVVQAAGGALVCRLPVPVPLSLWRCLFV